jgi:signal transduction histidine kinase
MLSPPENLMHAISQPISKPLGPALRPTDSKAFASRLAQRLDEADRRTNELLATVAHELRNPLESLGSAVEILSLSAADTATSSDAAAIARRQLKQMSRLISDLLDSGHIASCQQPLELSAVRLQDVLADAIETTAPAFSKHRHTLNLELPQQPIWIHADAPRCAQIFCNLLANAAKYTPPGGRITVAARQRHGVARVSVIDNGVGIAPEALPGVFELFRQEQRSLPLSQGGLGIGLSVVSQLVRLHGGAVHAESGGEHKGSTFVVDLPLFPGHRAAGRAGSH